MLNYESGDALDYLPALLGHYCVTDVLRNNDLRIPGSLGRHERALASISLSFHLYLFADTGQG